MTALELAKRWSEVPRILMVMPDEKAASGVAEALRHYVCEVDAVCTQEALLERLSSFEYAAVLISPESPNSIELIRLVLRMRPSTPVLVATTGTASWFVDLLDRLGMTLLHRANFQNTLRNAMECLSSTSKA